MLSAMLGGKNYWLINWVLGAIVGVVATALCAYVGRWEAAIMFAVYTIGCAVFAVLNVRSRKRPDA